MILVVLLHVLGVVFHGLSFIHGVKIEPRVIILNGLEVHPQGLLDAVRQSKIIGPYNQT